MKKLLFALMLCIVSIVSANAAQRPATVSGTTTNCLVFNTITQDWEELPYGYNIPVYIDNGVIYVYSKVSQKFNCYNVSDMHYNVSGHLQYTADAIDKDGKRCALRIVFRDDIYCEAPLQIYIYYRDVSYVYNVVITKVI